MSTKTFCTHPLVFIRVESLVSKTKIIHVVNPSTFSPLIQRFNQVTFASRQALTSAISYQLRAIHRSNISMHNDIRKSAFLIKVYLIAQIPCHMRALSF